MINDFFLLAISPDISEYILYMAVEIASRNYILKFDTDILYNYSESHI